MPSISIIAKVSSTHVLKQSLESRLILITIWFRSSTKRLMSFRKRRSWKSTKSRLTVRWRFSDTKSMFWPKNKRLWTPSSSWRKTWKRKRFRSPCSSNLSWIKRCRWPLECSNRRSKSCILSSGCWRQSSNKMSRNKINLIWSSSYKSGFSWPAWWGSLKTFKNWRNCSLLNKECSRTQINLSLPRLSKTKK